MKQQLKHLIALLQDRIELHGLEAIEYEMRLLEADKEEGTHARIGRMYLRGQAEKHNTAVTELEMVLEELEKLCQE